MGDFYSCRKPRYDPYQIHMVFGLLRLAAEPGLRSDSDLGALPNLEHLVAKVAKWYHQTWDKGSEFST